MQGFPKMINSRQDVINLLGRPEHAGQLRAKLQELIDSRFAWVVVGELQEGEAGLEDSNHRIQAEEKEGQTTRIQMELVEDPVAHIFRMGFTVTEVKALIEEASHA